MEINYTSNGKAMMIHLIVGLIKKTLHKMTQYFPKPYKPFKGDISVKVDLSSFATKADLKEQQELIHLKLAAKSDLANLKADIDQIDVDQLKIVPVDLSKINNVVNNDVVKKNCV